MQYEHYSLAGHERLRDHLARHRRRVARLVKAIERFLEGAGDATPAARRLSARKVVSEMFLVPSRETLQSAPDMACLLKADHSRKVVSLEKIYPELGGPNNPAWAEVERWSQDALERTAP